MAATAELVAADNPVLARQAAILGRPMTPERHMADAIRALAIDATEASKSGHPGLPMGMADVATALWTRFHKFDAADPHWPDRDRFVLSAGHGSMLLYALIYLTGHAGMTIDDIRNFRQLHSPAAGHPEYRRAPGDRDHHRAARPGHRHRGGHGAGRAHAGGAVRQVAGGPPHLGDRLRRRHDGGHQPRSRRAGRASVPVQADRAVRRQPHLDRRRYRAVVLRRRGEALFRLWLGHQARRRPRSGADRRGLVLRCALEEADADPVPHHHRPGRAAQGRHRRRCTARRLGPEEAAGAKAALGWHEPPFTVPEDLLERWHAAGSARRRRRAGPG